MKKHIAKLILLFTMSICCPLLTCCKDGNRAAAIQEVARIDRELEKLEKDAQSLYPYAFAGGFHVGVGGNENVGKGLLILGLTAAAESAIVERANELIERRNYLVEKYNL